MHFYHNVQLVSYGRYVRFIVMYARSVFGLDRVCSVYRHERASSNRSTLRIIVMPKCSQSVAVARCPVWSIECDPIPPWQGEGGSLATKLCPVYRYSSTEATDDGPRHAVCMRLRLRPKATWTEHFGPGDRHDRRDWIELGWARRARTRGKAPGFVQVRSPAQSW